MSWNRWGRTKSGRLIAGAGALVLAVGLSGCLKGPPPPPVDSRPQWQGTTVNLFHTQTPSTGAATGWVTTVTVPACFDNEGQTTIFGSVSNGSLFPQGNGTFAWTRQVTGLPPVTPLSGNFTATCRDSAGQNAHPTLAVRG
jgi:hypothetical protein